jgi:hypothetical protein
LDEFEKKANDRVMKEILFTANPSQVNTPKKITDTVSTIMEDGAAEFEKKMGRPMTYQEMREMYG